MTHRQPIRDAVTEVDEKEMLLAFMHVHQRTLLVKLGGLDDEQLRRRIVPSGTSLLGLLKHVAYVHASWFEVRFAGLDGDPDLPSPADDFAPEPDESFATLVARYERVCARVDEIVADAALDDVSAATRDSGAYDSNTFTMRWILVHMIEELARHNGHADILREQIDGAVGM
jgi:uncharacterized damage-inducible protein DinB